jgi:type II secretory pathway component GspD/PulD (secretin)
MAALALLVLLVAADAGATPAQKAPPAQTCKKLKDGTRVKLNLKPDSEVADVIAAYAALTCTGILMSNGTSLAGKKVTIVSPEPITIAELRRLFLGALDSVGLAAEPDGKFLRIIDAAKARPGATLVR